MKNKNTQWRNRIIIGAILLIILLVVGKRLKIIGGSDNLKVDVEKVGKRTIVETVSASGKLKPAKEVKISADVSGEIIALPIKEGDKVKKGDLLVKIRPDNYIAAVERTEATLNNAKANLENAKAQLTQAKVQYDIAEKSYQRNKKLHDQNAISDAEFDQVESDYKVKKAQVESGEQTVQAAKYTVQSTAANLKEARENLALTTIYAPTSGTISLLNTELGERVVGTMQMQGTEILRIADLDEMEMEVDVNENDIIRVDLGDTATIEIDAFLDEKFKGIVTEIANSAVSAVQTTEQVTSFPVTIRILKDSYNHLIEEGKSISTPFRPGMSGIVEITTEVKKDVVAVPILSVTTREVEKKKKGEEQPPEETEKSLINEDYNEVVFLYEDGKAVQQKVKTGIQDNEYIEILEGVKPGQEVISGPYRLVSKELEDGKEVDRTEK